MYVATTQSAPSFLVSETKTNVTDYKLNSGVKNSLLLGGDKTHSTPYHRALISGNATVSKVNVVNTNRFLDHKGGLYLSDQAIGNDVSVVQGQVQLIQNAVLNRASFSNHSMLDMHAGHANQITAENSKLYIYNQSKVDRLTANHDWMMVEGQINHATVDNSVVGLVGHGEIKNTQIHKTKVSVIGTNGVFNNVSGDATLKMRTNLMTGKTDKLNVLGHWQGNYKVDVTKLTKGGVATTGQGIELINSTDSVNKASVTLSHPVTAGILQYNLNRNDGSVYLKSGLNSQNTLNAFAPEAASNYDLEVLSGINHQLVKHKTYWLTQYGSEARFSRYHSTVQDNTLYTQIGGTVYHHQGANSQWKTGFAASIGQYRLTSDAFNSGSQTTKGKTVSNFIEWHNAQYYVDLINQFGFYQSATSGVKSKSRTYTASLMAGRHFALPHNWVLTPEAQVIYQKVRLPSYRLSGNEANTSINALTQSNTFGGLGFDLASNAYQIIHPYFNLHVYQRFNHEGDLSANSAGQAQTIALEGVKTWLNANVGANVNINPNFCAYASVGYQQDLNVHGQGIHGTIGMNYHWK